MKQILTFIGAGNMASSLIGGLIADHYPASNIWVTDPKPENLERLASTYNINTTTDNKKAAEKAEVLILAVKPQIIAQVATELAPIVRHNHPLVLTVAAGLQINSLNRWLGNQTAIVRCMPNTPALIRAGATALFANSYVSAKQKDMAESILRAVGLAVWVEDEAQLDSVTALSGSGPAYFFLVMEALEKAAVESGLTQEMAHLLTIQTAVGASRMALESSVSLSQLRQYVTSPGGTTEQAVEALQKNGIDALFAQALHAAKKRAEELAEQLGNT